PAAEAGPVLLGWADHLRGAPEELTSIADLANPMAGGPEAPVQLFVAVDSDDPAVADRLLAPLRDLGTVLTDDVAPRPYRDLLVEGRTPPPGMQLIPRNAFVARSGVPQALDVIADTVGSGRSPATVIRGLGGAMSRVPADATAFAHRDAELMIMTVLAGPAPVIEAARPGVDALWQRLAPHVTGAYANFLGTADEDSVAAAYPEPTRLRLAGIKRAVDPTNLFSANHNIRP